MLSFADGFKKLVGNMGRYRQLESETLAPGLSKDELIAYLKIRSDKCMVLLTENNIIIDNVFWPLYNNPEQIGDEYESVLFKSAQMLSMQGSQDNTIDLGFAMTIHECLLNCSRMRSRTDLLIRQLYHTANAKMKFHPTLFLDEAVQLFTEAAMYRSDYKKIRQKETRRLINSCMAKRYVALGNKIEETAGKGAEGYFAAIDEAISFWGNPVMQKHDANIPWDALIYNGHQSICAFANLLLPLNSENGKDEKFLAERINNSLAVISATQAHVNGEEAVPWPESRTNCVRLCVDFHLGKTSLADLFDGLLSIMNSAGDDDYSENGIYAVLHVPGVIFDYMNMCKESALPERKPILDKVLNYCANAAGSGDFMYERLIAMGHEINKIYGYTEDYLNLLLKFTSYRYMPIYVHSKQVCKITMKFAEYFMEKKPGLFIGLLGSKDEADVLGKKAELLNMIYYAAICHDIGKITFANTISLCSRRLYDFEFSLIKEHVQAGRVLPDSNELLRCVRDVIMGHHKWYDGSMGYPLNFDNTASPYRFIIDIVTAADSIDAVTDDIARTYAIDHSFTRVKDEIRIQSGTRYNPHIARALNDAAFLKELEHTTEEGRKDTYYEAYGHFALQIQ